MSKKTDKTHCKKCRKKVEAKVDSGNNLICPNCSTNLGFVSYPRKNLFIEMVQVYLDYKKIKAKATINKDGHLDIKINFNKEDHQQLADLLSNCMPISYIISNTALKKSDRRSGKQSKGKKGKQRNKNNLESFF